MFSKMDWISVVALSILLFSAEVLTLTTPASSAMTQKFKSTSRSTSGSELTRGSTYSVAATTTVSPMTTTGTATTVSPITTTTATTTTTTTTTTTSRPYSESLRFVDRSFQDNQEVYVLVGTTFILDCRVEGYPQPNITWDKDDKPLSDASYRVFYGSMKKVFVLELNDLIIADSGKYKCTADNGIVKEIATSLVLVVSENKLKFKPEIVTFSPNNTIIYAGESVSFSCSSEKVKDALVPFIKWTRHSQYNISNTTNITARDTSTLKVMRLSKVSYVEDNVLHKVEDLELKQSFESIFELTFASLDDSGEYSCVVFNNKGYSKRTMQLTVIPVPPLPKHVLEENYIKKYGKPNNLPYSLPVLIVLPVMLLVLLVIGCVWWNENEKRICEEQNKQKPYKKLVEVKKPPPKKNIPIVMIKPSSYDDYARSHQSLGDSEIEFKIMNPSVTSLPCSKAASMTSLPGSKTRSVATSNDEFANEETVLLVEMESPSDDRGSTKSLDQEWEHI